MSEGIQALKPGSHSHDLDNWDRVLKAFEDMGMEVAFLQAHMPRLKELSREHDDVALSPKLQEWMQAVEELDAVKKKLAEREEFIVKLDLELAEIETKKKKTALMFEEVASAPWWKLSKDL